jgi:hypothetical protein
MNNYSPIDDAVWFHVMLHKHKKHTKNPNRASSKMNKHKKAWYFNKIVTLSFTMLQRFEEAY